MIVTPEDSSICLKIDAQPSCSFLVSLVNKTEKGLKILLFGPEIQNYQLAVRNIIYLDITINATFQVEMSFPECDLTNNTISPVIHDVTATHGQCSNEGTVDCVKI